MILYGPNGEEIRIVEFRESIGFVPVLIEIEDQDDDPADCIAGDWVELEEEEE